MMMAYRRRRMAKGMTDAAGMLHIADALWRDSVVGVKCRARIVLRARGVDAHRRTAPLCVLAIARIQPCHACATHSRMALGVVAAQLVPPA